MLIIESGEQWATGPSKERGGDLQVTNGRRVSIKVLGAATRAKKSILSLLPLSTRCLIRRSSPSLPYQVVQTGSSFTCFFNHVILGDGQLAGSSLHRRSVAHSAPLFTWSCGQMNSSIRTLFR